MKERLAAASVKGNAVLVELHKNPEWRARKASRISQAIKDKGGRFGSTTFALNTTPVVVPENVRITSTGRYRVTSSGAYRVTAV